MSGTNSFPGGALARKIQGLRMSPHEVSRAHWVSGLLSTCPVSHIPGKTGTGDTGADPTTGEKEVVSASH